VQAEDATWADFSHGGGRAGAPGRARLRRA
jgi:hypothetical protein